MPTYLSPGVYVEEMEAAVRPIEGVGTAVAAFVGLAAQGPVNTPTLVSNWTQFTQTFGDFVPGTFLAHSVYGYFMNGGGNCYIVRVGADEPASGRGARKEPSALPAAPQAQVGGYRVQAIGQGPDRSGAAPQDVSIEVADAGGENPPEGSFKLIVKRGNKTEETYDQVTAAKGKQNVATVVNAASKLVHLEEVSGVQLERPATGSTQLAPPPPAVLVPDQRQMGAGEYLGDVSQRTGFGGLETIEEVTMVCCPDLMAAYQAGSLDLETLQAVQLGMIAHCELMGDRLAVLDPPPGLNAQQVKEWRVDKAGYDSKYAALYWPWVKVLDPVSGTNIHVPPSGHIAGIWSRNDDSRGVHKAPANEVVRGVVSLEASLTSTEQELLNPVGINCIRAFAGRGIRVWGARTLSSDPSWRYINVRRLFNYLEESILGGTQWVVFEPNDDALWARIRRTVSAFLVNEWRKGALFGLTPDEAFYVKCDRETNPAEAIDAGLVTCEIGVAPVKPAEFVVFRLAQFSGGTSLVAE